jgi:hypothetical protein
LLKDDIGIVRKGGQREVMTRSDVHVINVGAGQSQTELRQGKSRPRILHIVDEKGSTGLGGYYLRLPDTAFGAYGDILPGFEGRGVVWAGNKVEYVMSITLAPHFSMRSDWMRL